MKKIRVVMALLLCPLSVNASSSQNVFDIEERIPVKILNVDEVFPMRDTHYSKEEFLAGFKLLIHDHLWGDFAAGWSAIYDGYTEAPKSDKPKRLSVEKETEHIHCFYNSLRGSDPLDFDMQKITIYSRFLAPTHKRLIAAKNSDLADRVTDFMQ